MWIGLCGIEPHFAGKKSRSLSGEDVLTARRSAAFMWISGGALWIGMLGSGLGRCHKNQLQIITPPSWFAE